MTKELQAIWASAVPLDLAPVTLADPDLIAKYKRFTREVGQPRAIVSLLDGPDSSFQAEVEGWNADFAKIAGYFMAVCPSLGERDLRADIQVKIYDGDLVALGFEEPRRMDDPPRIVPIDAWRGKVDWSKSRVSWDGLSMIGIRLIAANQTRTIEHASPSQSTKSLPRPFGRSRGRPSVEQQIIVTYEALMEGGEIDISQSKGAIYRQVADNMCSDNAVSGTPTDVPPSEKTLAKYLSTKIDGDRRKGT